MKKLYLILLSAIMMFSLCACGKSENTDGGNSPVSEEANIKIQFEIDYPDESGAEDVDDIEISIPAGSSAMEALNEYANNNNCEIVMSDKSATAYVVSIGGVAATDTAGWVYEINDEMVMEAADKCKLNDGDEVSWSFETWE